MIQLMKKRKKLVKEKNGSKKLVPKKEDKKAPKKEDKK